MKRGDVVVASPRGDYGKPRPCVVIQSDLFEPTDSLLVCLVTSEMGKEPDLRLTLHPGPTNGLRSPSQVMVEKITTVRRERCRTIGALKPSEIGRLNALLATVIGLNG